MRRPGDSRINAGDALRIAALFQQAADVRDAQPKPVPVPQVALVESVDRDDKQLFSRAPFQLFGRRAGSGEPKSEKYQEQ